MQALTLRTATQQDVQSILRLWRASGSVRTVSDTPEAVRALMALDPDALVIAESEGYVVGSVIAGWDGWRGNLYRLAVSPEHRRRGIGSALVKEGERRLRRRGATRLTAIVVDDDVDAMAFWHATGLIRQTHRARFARDL